MTSSQSSNARDVEGCHENIGMALLSVTLKTALARGACQGLRRGLRMSTSLTLAMGSPLLVATRLKLRT